VLLDIIKWGVEVETGLKFPTGRGNSEILYSRGNPRCFALWQQS